MGRYHNTDEECWIMGVELIVDVALPAESSDEDETGVGILTVACNQAFKALSVVGIGLVEGAQICDDVVDMGCGQIGRASCRAGVCQYVSISVVADSVKKKKQRT